MSNRFILKQENYFLEFSCYKVKFDSYVKLYHKFDVVKYKFLCSFSLDMCFQLILFLSTIFITNRNMHAKAFKELEELLRIKNVLKVKLTVCG